MGTKVKGEAIKEGSIPLSALATEVKDKIENAGGGANWDAAEGEAGYIENKPFGIGEELIPLDMIVKFSQLQKVSVDWASNVFDVYLHPDPGYDSFISKDINPDADDILNIKEKGAGRVFGYSINNKMIYEEIDHNNFNQTLDGIDTQFDFVLGMKYSQDTIGDTGNYFVVYEGVMYVIHNITYNKIYNDESYMNVYHTEKIHENYLPDTVLKTTPQTLSESAKNQALANLGIDNTKYILSVAPDNKFNIREFIDKFGFIAELNDDGYGGYIGDLIVTNKELFLDKVLCCGFNGSLAKCIYVNNSGEVVFFFEEGITKGRVKVGFAKNDMNSEPTMIGWEPLG